MNVAIGELLEALARPEAFAAPTRAVEVRQTHISAVFLGDDVVYKIKKPVSLGFLDFRDLAQRRRFCEREAELNLRLAPCVYLGVVPVTRGPHGLRFEGDGPALEWAVKMTRLPEEATLESRLTRGELTAHDLASLAQRLAAFHANAARGPEIARYASFAAVSENALGNFPPLRAGVGEALPETLVDRLEARTRAALAEAETRIDARAARGVACDTHGDLRLDHVYRLAGEWVIVDCIEFNDRFRYADPVADVAFLTMDLAFRGRRDLAWALARAYATASGDGEAARLFPLYASYRAAVRAKVDAITLSEAEIPPPERRAAERRRRAHVLAALAWLEPPERRPEVVLVGGLPGTGKSTVARGLADALGYELLRSDVVRKELAGLAPLASAATAPGTGIYTDAWSDRTYAELTHRAESLVARGGRVIVDAGFRTDAKRRALVEAATSWGVPVRFLRCTASDAVVRARLAARRNDASDADVAMHVHLAAEWEPLTRATQPFAHDLSTEGPAADVLHAATDLLRALP